MPAPKPKQLFWVEFVENPSGTYMRTYERKSGKFTNKAHALARIDHLRNRGHDGKLFQTQELEWTEVEVANF